MLDLSSQFEEVVRSDLPCDSSGRGATLAYRITPHYKQLGGQPSQPSGEQVNTRFATAVWVA